MPHVHHTKPASPTHQLPLWRKQTYTTIILYSMRPGSTHRRKSTQVISNCHTHARAWAITWQPSVRNKVIATECWISSFSIHSVCVVVFDNCCPIFIVLILVISFGFSTKLPNQWWFRFVCQSFKIFLGDYFSDQLWFHVSVTSK